MSKRLPLVALALVLLVLGALEARGEIQFRPMEPDPAQSPFMRPVRPQVEVPETKILPLETPGAATPAAIWETAVVVQRPLGGLVIRQGDQVRTLRLSPLGPSLPADLRDGERVEIRCAPDGLLQALRRPGS